MHKIVALALTSLFGAVLYAADKPVTVDLKDADGKDVGTAKISDKGTGVKIALDLKGLPPGEHADSHPSEREVRRPEVHHRWRPFQPGYEEARYG